MTRILNFSFPKEDEELIDWLEQKSEASGVDKSKLVRQGLRLLQAQDTRRESQLDRIEGKQDTGLDKQDEILGILRELKERGRDNE